MSREVVGVEALIRWQHPEEGLLLPNAFLPYLDGSELEEFRAMASIHARVHRVAAELLALAGKGRPRMPESVCRNSMQPATNYSTNFMA